MITKLILEPLKMVKFEVSKWLMPISFPIRDSNCHSAQLDKGLLFNINIIFCYIHLIYKIGNINDIRAQSLLDLTKGV